MDDLPASARSIAHPQMRNEVPALEPMVDGGLERLPESDEAAINVQLLPNPLGRESLGIFHIRYLGSWRVVDLLEQVGPPGR